jgi:RNA polymerase sigma factor (sigma-70 family)
MSIVQAISRPGVRRSRPASAEDAKLVERVRAGDERAFETIFKRHHASLLSYARHMLANQDEAEDALQQAFIKAHRALLGGTAPRELRPWLYAIVRNCCLSAIAARRRTVELDERTASLAGLAEAVYEREDLRELLADIGRLPEDQRSALLLAELDDLSHQSIATIVDCPVSKVKALIYQARSALIADRDARGASCHDIREELASARGGQLRRGPLRRHLSLCVGCRDFQQALATQRRSLAVALPVLPSAGLAAKILSHSALQAAIAASHAGGAIGSAAAPAGATAAPASAAAAPAGSAVAPLATAAAPAGAVAGGGASAGATASTVAGAGAGASGGTGAVVGSGVIAKVAVGGAVAALATAGAVTGVRHLAHPHRRHSAHAYVERAHRSRLTLGARPKTQLLAASRTLSGTVSTAANGATPPQTEPPDAPTSDTALSDPLSQSSPQSPQRPPLASALASAPATSVTTTASATQTPSEQSAQPQSGPSGDTTRVIHQRREPARRQLELRRLRQAERRQLQAQRRRLAREERLRKARALKEARERRKRLREERQRKARELREAKEQRERLREERQRKAQELKEAREHRELEAQRKRQQREAPAATPQPSTQTTPSSTPATTTTPTTTPTEAPSTTSSEATGVEGKRRRKKN